MRCSNDSLAGTTRRGVLAGAMAGGLLIAWPYRPTAQTLEPTPAVETSSGKVRGRRTGGVSAFLGIPYGSDTRTHRFRPAHAPNPWTGVLDCAAFGAQAPQMELNAAAIAGPGANLNSDFVKQVMTIFRAGMEIGNESENCLFLNVYTPDASLREKRPVMVWLHGGAFSIGSAGDPQYDGSALCRRGDVVVVTLNHRLNALGYLYLGALHDDFADSGNIGQLDIILALQWVRDHIAAFGGDAGNVTIFGESGGGAKVSTLLAMPPAKGLFHKAIVQSGPGVSMEEKAKAAELAERTLATLGVAKADVHKLQAMDRKAIINAASAAQKPSDRRSLSPVVDGRSLPTHPFTPRAPDVSRDIPVIVGTTKDESTLFLSADPTFGKMTDEQARAHFVAMLGDKGASALEVYRALRPDDPPTYWVTAMMTDTMMRMDSIRLAERKLAQRAAPVFMYRLDWETPILDGAMRSPHGLDVPLVFDNVDKKRGLFGPGPEPKQVAAVMSQAWINFARSGSPSQRGVAWPLYDSASRRTMIFDTTSRVASDPDGSARSFWSG
jgi:para-nitrobenzyl esterase